MHDEIHKFSLDGQIGDANLVEAKERLVLFLEDKMRDEGFVPALDIEPQFTLDYRPKDETYDFILTVYGIWVGRESACNTIAGMMSGKPIMKFIPSDKLRQS